MRIDAHHHFWCYEPEEYAWIGPHQDVLRRDYLPPDLDRVLGLCGFDGAVSVQARQTLEETRWLLDLAADHDFLLGVVGWVPLTSPTVHRDLNELADNPKLVGVRHVLQDEGDDQYALREDFTAGIRSLTHRGLVYDILIYERHLPAAIALVDRHPEQVFVLDHVAKPRIAEGIMSPWRENIADLAQRPNVFCKLSGMVTEADPVTWREWHLQPYVDTVLEAFGPNRIMFGSDWPVCLLAASYERWFHECQNLLGELSDDEQERIFGGTAMEAYGLDLAPRTEQA